ncbi:MULTISPECIES: ROK family transcriptional regulator [unclassified Rathayibacter]|uniref:ROK family transcriptional regulator n=1 Tax=unclassified Rathayibacter TaxID=2609250 RepID=UPI0006F6F721|nr:MULTISPECIES: ROK family protein [unclassified Rathayibacter]KQQ06200.1 transcriptional regulator [Rathayibacter sp. Leaf294]KQS14056.1 transcriptional regulator [Rathayibacter sp. Leaf185]
MRAGVAPSTLRRLNSSVVLRALAEHDEPVTMAVLVREVALSRRTVELILARLCDEGWVDETAADPAKADVGRPPRTFRFRADRALVAAVRIDTDFASAVVCDIRGRILGRSLRPLREYSSPEASVEDVVHAVEEAVAASGLPRERIHAGAVAAGGAIDERGVVTRLVNSRRWNGFALADALADRLGVPFFADNDANLAALAERWRGVAADSATSAWCILGNRTGVGLVINGAVHRGFRGAAGELIEAGALATAGMENTPFGFLTSPQEAERELAHRSADAARAGDPEMLRELDAFVDHLAALLSTLSWTVSPDLIVLGGGLEEAEDLLLPRVTVAMRALGTLDVDVRSTVLGTDAPLIGAVKFVLDRMDVAFFGPTLAAQPTRPRAAVRSRPS